MHSPIGGSNAGIWGRCDAYVATTATLPPSETEHTRNGTAAHEVGYGILSAAAQGRTLRWSDFEGKFATNGVPFTEEMFEAAEVYADHVLGVMRSTGVFGGQNLMLETLVSVPRVHSAAFGTMDAALYKDHVLHVWDFKFGHRYVDPFESAQLTFYTAGILERLGINGLEEQSVAVKFHIVSPRVYNRGGPVHTWATNAADLRGMINRLHARAHAQFEPNPVATTGPHCYDCPGRLQCPAALRAGLNLYETAMVATPEPMSDEAAGLQLQLIERAIEQLSAMQTAFSERVFETVKSGKQVAGWMVDQTYGRKTWVCSPEDVFAVGDSQNVDLRKAVPLTPTQAKKAGLDPTLVDQLSTVPKRGLKLVPDDGTLAKRVFSNE